MTSAVDESAQHTSSISQRANTTNQIRAQYNIPRTYNYMFVVQVLNVCVFRNCQRWCITAEAQEQVSKISQFK